MGIEFESIGGGRHSVVVEDAGRRRRTDVVVSGDVKDRARPLWFYGVALSGRIQERRPLTRADRADPPGTIRTTNEIGVSDSGRWRTAPDAPLALIRVPVGDGRNA